MDDDQWEEQETRTPLTGGPRIIDLAEKPAFVSIENRLLCLAVEDQETVKVEPSEVAALLVSHYAVTITRSALAELSRAGAIVVICDQRSTPVAMTLPLEGFHAPARRMSHQADATRPLRKRLWQTIVRAKINAQAALLARRRQPCLDLIRLASECKSGDPANVEAQAARLYWPRLFGPAFRRQGASEPSPTDENRYLNYGYAILRAMVCRAICGAGLHPGLGLQHHHRNNAFPLADDLMEPFRPLVDDLALNLKENRGADAPLDRTAKADLLGLLRIRVSSDGEQRLVPDVLQRIAGRLGLVFEGQSKSLDFPRLWSDDRHNEFPGSV